MLSIKEQIQIINEDASIEKSVMSLKPGDTFIFFTIKEVKEGIIPVFKPGVRYSGKVLKSGKMLIKHENVWPVGNSSTLTKKTFLKKLKDNLGKGESLCRNLLDCDRSTITRPGVGTYSFTKAMSGEVGKPKPVPKQTG